MIYCVVPRELADELYPKLVQHYEGEPNVTVIVERREFDRRARLGAQGGRRASDHAERRAVRDRRRARVAGDFLPLAQSA